MPRHDTNFARPVRLAATIALSAALGWFAGCDDDGGGGFDMNRSCPELCSMAQAGSCTSVSGDCDEFCAALDASKDAANCTSEVDTYTACLNQTANVCDVDCDSEETTLANCMAAYCLGNASDPDCMVLIASFS